MDMIKTGRFIAERRKEKGLTQQALAEQLFVTAKTVSRWENGNYAPPVDALPALAEILGTTADEILAGERRQDAPQDTAPTTPHESRFSLKERTEFYKKKWLREHGVYTVIILVGIVLIMIGTLKNGIYWAAGIEAVFAGFVLFFFRNRMMAYIEKNAYDGTGGDKQDDE